MISHRVRPFGRRDLLGFAATALVATIPLRLARAQAAGDASATAPVEQLDNALLAAMKAGGIGVRSLQEAHAALQRPGR